MSAQPAHSARMLLGGLGIVACGVVVAFVTDVALSQLSLAKVCFLLGGVALLLPTLALKDAKAFWLFLLVLSMPFDISKWLSAGVVDPQSLVDEYGMPASGTVSIELYVTDVILLLMLLPWLIRACVRREALYFPRVGYIYLFYLCWALLVSIVNAESFYLSLVELFREVLYFLSFVYLINNVRTPPQLRTVIAAVFLGLIIGAGSVIAFFEMGIGTDYIAFASLRDQSHASDAPKPGQSSKSVQNLTVSTAEPGLASQFRGHSGERKRSQGMFRHPAVAASLCGLSLPLVLAYLVTARTTRDRLFFGFVYVWGIAGLVLTFSRAGLLGFIVGTLTFIAVGSWSGLIPRRALTVAALVVAGAAVLSIPFLVSYFTNRTQSYDMRFDLFWAALQGYAQHPLLGVGLNNSTAAMREGKQVLRDLLGVKIPATESTDSHYLALFVELGPLGFAAFFLFFGKIVVFALRAMRRVEKDMKVLLVGIVVGMASLAAQDLADDAFAPHAISALVWLFAALVIVIARGTAPSSDAVHAGRPFVDQRKASDYIHTVPNLPDAARHT